MRVSVRWPVCLLFTTTITKLHRLVTQLLSFLMEFLFQEYISFTSPSLSLSSLSVFQRVLGHHITVKIKKYFILHCSCFFFHIQFPILSLSASLRLFLKSLQFSGLEKKKFFAEWAGKPICKTNELECHDESVRHRAEVKPHLIHTALCNIGWVPH